jgi:hypothetical protein
MWILRLNLRGGGQVEMFYKGRDNARRDEKVLLGDGYADISDDYGKTMHVDAATLAGFLLIDYEQELAGMEVIARLKIDLNARMQRAAAAKAGMLGNGSLVAQGFQP